MDVEAILDELMRAKVDFQLRAIGADMGYPIITQTHFDEAAGETVTKRIDPMDFYAAPPQAAKD